MTTDQALTPEDQAALTFLGDMGERVEAWLAEFKRQRGTFRSQGDLETSLRDLHRAVQIETKKRTPTDLFVKE